MKKLLIVLLILLALVVGGLLYADTRIKKLAQEHAEQEIAKALPQLSGVHVTIDGFPLAWGVLVRGQVEALHLQIDHVQEAGLQAHDLRLDVETISLDKDALIDEQRLVITDIGKASAQGFVNDEEVSKLVDREVVFTPGKVTTTWHGQEIEAKAAVNGRTVALSTTIPGVPPVIFPLPPADVLPCSPQLELLDGKLRLSCSIDELPPAIKTAMAKAQ